MFLPSSGQEMETNQPRRSQTHDCHLRTSEVRVCFLKPGPQPKGITLKPTLPPPHPRPLLPFWEQRRQHTHIPTHSFSYSLSLTLPMTGFHIKMEGALQVLKAFIAWGIPSPQQRRGRRKRPEREERWRSQYCEDKRYPRSRNGCTS